MQPHFGHPQPPGTQVQRVKWFRRNSWSQYFIVCLDIALDPCTLVRGTHFRYAQPASLASADETLEAAATLVVPGLLFHACLCCVGFAVCSHCFLFVGAEFLHSVKCHRGTPMCAGSRSQAKRSRQISCVTKRVSS